MSATGLAPEDIIAAGGFIAVVIAALGYHTLRSAVANSPRARMRRRVLDSVSEVAPTVSAKLSEDASELASRRRKKWLEAENALVRMLVAAYEQAQHMGGGIGLRGITIAGIAALVAGAALPFWLDVSGWFAAATAPLACVAAMALAHTVLVQRYRARFLAGFPDALDLMIRAVRAGVPVVQAIINAGRELPHPVGREFKIMGDALRLGMDQQEVMDTASKRIGVPDFRFFVVCLQLQRETGGPLAETLENLSSIIRARREVRLKTRALTAQGRAAAKIIALVPFVVMGALKFIGPDYVDVLFDTESGRNVLYLAVGLVITGLVIIARMSRLED